MKKVQYLIVCKMLLLTVNVCNATELMGLNDSYVLTQKHELLNLKKQSVFDLNFSNEAEKVTTALIEDKEIRHILPLDKEEVIGLNVKNCLNCSVFYIDDIVQREFKKTNNLNLREKKNHDNDLQKVFLSKNVNSSLFEKKILLKSGAWNLIANSNSTNSFSEQMENIASHVGASFYENRVSKNFKSNKKQVQQKLKKYLLNIFLIDGEEVFNTKEIEVENKGSFDSNMESHGVISKNSNNTVVSWSMDSQSVLLQKRFAINSMLSTEVGAGLSYKKVGTKKNIDNFSYESNTFSGIFPSIRVGGSFKKSNSLIEGYVEGFSSSSGYIFDWGVAWSAPFLGLSKDVQLKISYTGARISNSAMTNMKIGIDSNKGDYKTRKLFVGLNLALK